MELTLQGWNRYFLVIPMINEFLMPQLDELELENMLSKQNSATAHTHHDSIRPNKN